MAANEGPDHELPLEFVIPKRIVLTRRSFEKIVERMKEKAAPPALVALMRGSNAGHQRD